MMIVFYCVDRLILCQRFCENERQQNDSPGGRSNHQLSLLHHRLDWVSFRANFLEKEQIHRLITETDASPQWDFSISAELWRTSSESSPWLQMQFFVNRSIKVLRDDFCNFGFCRLSNHILTSHSLYFFRLILISVSFFQECNKKNESNQEREREWSSLHIRLAKPHCLCWYNDDNREWNHWDFEWTTVNPWKIKPLADDSSDAKKSNLTVSFRP